PSSLASCSLPQLIPPTLSFLFPPTPTPQSYTLSLHDALPIYSLQGGSDDGQAQKLTTCDLHGLGDETSPDQDYELNTRRGLKSPDRKSTRLNSSHVKISYAVFCLKKKKNSRMEKKSNLDTTSY